MPAEGILLLNQLKSVSEQRCSVNCTRSSSCRLLACCDHGQVWVVCVHHMDNSCTVSCYLLINILTNRLSFLVSHPSPVIDDTRGAGAVFDDVFDDVPLGPLSPPSMGTIAVRRRSKDVFAPAPAGCGDRVVSIALEPSQSGVLGVVLKLAAARNGDTVVLVERVMPGFAAWMSEVCCHIHLHSVLALRSCSITSFLLYATFLHYQACSIRFLGFLLFAFCCVCVCVCVCVRVCVRFRLHGPHVYMFGFRS